MIAKEAYERHISDLEDENETLRATVAKLQDDRRMDKVRLLAEKEKFFLGLQRFLSTLTKQLSGIQNDVLKTTILLNEELGDVSSKRITTTISVLNEVTKPLLEMEQKTSGGIFRETEDIEA